MKRENITDLIKRPAALYIFQTGETYTISLETPTESPSGLAGTVSVSAADRQDVLTALDRVIGFGASPESFAPEMLASVGRLMYGLFLPRSIQDFLEAWDGPLTISTNDPAIPWELLHDDQTFLGIKCPVGRRLLSARRPPPRAIPQRERLAFLFIADPSGTLDGAAEEAQHLVSTLSRRGFPCDLLLAERASYLNVQAALGSGRYDVIHYAGHTRFGQSDGLSLSKGGGGESALELAQERVLPAGQVERVLRGAPLVFLNACASGRIDRQDAAPMSLAYLGAATESLASAFIFGGAQGFIGTLWPVPDQGSRIFAATFYDQILAGNPVGEALRATRQHLRHERPADTTWASFVLYGDPTYRLWEGPPAAPSVKNAGDVLHPRPAEVVRLAAIPQEETVEGQRGGLRPVAGMLVMLVVIGLLSVAGWWAYGRVSGELADQKESATPAALTMVATNTAMPAPVTASARPTTTNTLPLPTSTPSQQPIAYPLPHPTMTEPAGVQMLRGRLAFVSKPQSGLSTLYVMDVGNMSVQKLGFGIDPDWSPAGDKIAFAGLLEVEPGIHLINPDGTGRVRLTDHSDWQPTWSPDGQRIAFMSHRDGNREIYVMNADGREVRRISNNPWEDRHPSWSPLGDRIAFISNRSGHWQVWVMNTDGSWQVRLTHNDYDTFRPVWSPDGKQIAYGVWTGIQNEVWVMNADGSNEHRVTANAIYKQEFVGYGLAWEPKDFISFVSNRSGQPQIYAMNPDGSKQTAITSMSAGAFSPAWSP